LQVQLDKFAYAKSDLNAGCFHVGDKVTIIHFAKFVRLSQDLGALPGLIGYISKFIETIPGTNFFI
jgi:hypothetical protein